MEEDPSLYRRFSRMLQDTIEDYRAARLAEREYLQRELEIAVQVGTRKRANTLPETIANNDDAAAI
jgi:type I restriction enzyme R subunit